MKIKLSISVEDELLDKVQSKIDSGIFRNTSHAVEFAVNKFLEGIE